MDFSFQYAGEISAIVEVELGGKYADVKIPLSVKDIEISGKLHTRLDLDKRFPFVREMTFVIADPKFDFAVKPLRSFDLLGVPFLKDWIHDVVVDKLEATPIKINLESMIPEECNFGDVSLAVVISEKSLGRKEAAQLQQNRKQIGTLHIKLIEAKQLISADTSGTILTLVHVEALRILSPSFSTERKRSEPQPSNEI